MNIEDQLSNILTMDNIQHSFDDKKEDASENSTVEEETRELIKEIQSELSGLEDITKKFITITEDKDLTPLMQEKIFTMIKATGENAIFQLSDLYKKMTGFFLTSGTIKLLGSLQDELNRAQFNIPNEIEFAVVGIVFAVKTLKSMFGKFIQPNGEINSI
jgi:hypothetical protein